MDNQTYFIYAISPAVVSSGASCVASTSPNGPQFTSSQFAGTGYQILATGGTLSTSTTVFNVYPFNGVMIGDSIQTAPPDNTILPGTTIAGFSANAGQSTAPTGTWTAASTSTIGVSSTSGIQLGMAVLDMGADHCIPSQTNVIQILGGPLPQIVLNNTTSCAEASGAPLSISGARQLVLSGSSGASSTEVANLVIGTGYYRLIGALNTNGSGDFGAFTQDGDTFYLSSPELDFNGAVTTGGNTVLLNSLPLGISVKAFGRCVGGASMGTHRVILYSPSQTAPVPANMFPIAPGFDVSSLTPSTAYPFSAWTSTARSLLAYSDAATGVTMECMTDGWVLHR